MAFQGGQGLVVPAMVGDAVLLEHLHHRLRVRRLRLGVGIGDLLERRRLDHGLVGGGQGVVRGLVHQELVARDLLVPARVVVVLGDLVEAEIDVDGRHRELGGVDDAALERGIDVRPREQLRGHAHLLHDLGAEAEEPHLEALELLGRIVDRLLEPTRGLRADAEAIDRGRAVRVVDLFAQLLAAPEPLPGEVLADLRPEGDRAEEGERGAELAHVEAGGGPARFDRTLGHRVEDLQGRYQRVRLEVLDLELSFRHLVDPFHESDAGGSDMDQAASVPALHLPADALLGARVQCGGSGHCARNARHCNESCVFLQHGSFSPESMSSQGPLHITFAVDPGGACAPSERPADRPASRRLVRHPAHGQDRVVHRTPTLTDERRPASRAPAHGPSRVVGGRPPRFRYGVRAPVRGGDAPCRRSVTSTGHGPTSSSGRLKPRRFSTIMRAGSGGRRRFGRFQSRNRSQ